MATTRVHELPRVTSPQPAEIDAATVQASDLMTLASEVIANLNGFFERTRGPLEDGEACGTERQDFGNGSIGELRTQLDRLHDRLTDARSLTRRLSRIG